MPFKKRCVIVDSKRLRFVPDCVMREISEPTFKEQLLATIISNRVRPRGMKIQKVVHRVPWQSLLLIGKRLQNLKKIPKRDKFYYERVLYSEMMVGSFKIRCPVSNLDWEGRFHSVVNKF